MEGLRGYFKVVMECWWQLAADAMSSGRIMGARYSGIVGALKFPSV